MRISNYFLLSILFFFASLKGTFIDLEEAMLDSFVLETTKIEIPEYPNAFNPSIIRWKQGFLMSFRSGNYTYDSYLLSFRTRDPASGSTNGICLILLDTDFKPISAPQELEIPHDNPAFAHRQQDPRLISIKNHTYIVYSNMIEGAHVPEIRRMFIAELHYDGVQFFTGRADCITHFEGQTESRWQKNWVPFEYQGHLMLSYSINPHKVFYPYSGTGACKLISISEGKISWEWGVLRGGTQAFIEGSEYLAFFHSSKEMKSAHSKGKKLQHYFMGAYTFESEPPFKVTKISPKPIVGKNFYHGELHATWKPLHVVFPCGYVSDKNYFYIAYGRQDHEIWIATLDKTALMQSLVPVESD